MYINDFKRYMTLMSVMRIKDFDIKKHDLKENKDKLYIAVFSHETYESFVSFYSIPIQRETKFYYYLPIGKRAKSLNNNYFSPSIEGAYQKAGKRANNYVLNLEHKLGVYKSYLKDFNGNKPSRSLMELQEFADLLE